MRIKVNPKENSLTGDKMGKGESGRRSCEEGAQLYTFTTANLTLLLAGWL